MCFFLSVSFAWFPFWHFTESYSKTPSLSCFLFLFARGAVLLTSARVYKARLFDHIRRKGGPRLIHFDVDDGNSKVGTEAHVGFPYIYTR